MFQIFDEKGLGLGMIPSRKNVLNYRSLALICKAAVMRIDEMITRCEIETVFKKNLRNSTNCTLPLLTKPIKIKEKFCSVFNHRQARKNKYDEKEILHDICRDNKRQNFRNSYPTKSVFIMFFTLLTLIRKND